MSAIGMTSITRLPRWVRLRASRRDRAQKRRAMMRAIRATHRRGIRNPSIQIVVENWRDWKARGIEADAWIEDEDEWVTVWTSPSGMLPSVLNRGCISCGGKDACDDCERGRDIPF